MNFKKKYIINYKEATVVLSHLMRIEAFKNMATFGKINGRRNSGKQRTVAEYS